MRKCMVLIMFVSLLLVGCSTHRVQLAYSPPPSRSSATLPAIMVGEFTDLRGRDALRNNGTWIGAIRGGYGNTFKTVLLEQPVHEVVTAIFTEALQARDALADPHDDDTTLVLSGSVITFSCKQYMRRDCLITLNVILSDRATQNKIFEKQYEVYKFDGSVWAIDTGIFGSVNKLRDLAARTLSACVDKALDDGELINAAIHPKTTLQHSRGRK